jgi:hypothetical protein
MSVRNPWVMSVRNDSRWPVRRATLDSRQGKSPFPRRGDDHGATVHAVDARDPTICARIEKSLETLTRRLERAPCALDRGPIERQIGRILERNSRAAGRYQIHLREDSTRASTLRLDWSARTEWDEWARSSEGYYILRTNITHWTPESLWATYIQLTEAEAAFRIHKSDLGLRPVWHQKSERVQAHIFVCFLAYVFWKTLEQWQRRAGLGNSPLTILQELGRIQSTDIVLPLAGSSGKEVRIRCVVRPDADQ